MMMTDDEYAATIAHFEACDKRTLEALQRWQRESDERRYQADELLRSVDQIEAILGGMRGRLRMFVGES